MIGGLGGVFGSQIYSMLASRCFPCIFRREAACCTCVVWDGIAILEAFVDIHGSIKSQQPILLQKIECLKQVYLKSVFLELLPQGEGYWFHRHGRKWNPCNQLLKWLQLQTLEPLGGKKKMKRNISHSSICSQPVLMAWVISEERVIMREREKAWDKQEKYTCCF